QSAESSTQDLQAARALFERNIRAIQEKSKADYLDCYWPEPSLVRVGVAGPALGFNELAESTSEDPSEWPISLEAHDLDLHRVAPGVVYGIYRYVVVYPDKPPATGWSERVFVKRNNRWWIAVTTAFDTLPEEPASDDEP
ncbi:MAG: nuclear transport factor 2 family protein, partial [Myxococcota bacterium]